MDERPGARGKNFHRRQGNRRPDGRRSPAIFRVHAEDERQRKSHAAARSRKIAPRRSRMAANARAHFGSYFCAVTAAAARSGQPQLAAQITNFQNACRGTARRIGLTPFVAAPDEPFDAERHQVAGEVKTVRMARLSPKPSARATRFKENCFARRWCECARQTQPPNESAPVETGDSAGNSGNARRR